MKNATTKPSDYKHIAVWGQRLGSFPYYIRDQQEKACRTGAPINATYEKYATDGTGPTGEWATADNIASVETREQVERAVKALSLQKPNAVCLSVKELLNAATQ